MVQRNSLGGRAWLSKTTVTPRTNSRRKKKTYGTTGSNRKLKHFANLLSDNKGTATTAAVPKEIKFQKDDDVSATQLSDDADDFAFHSQSSLPNGFL